MEKRNGNRAKSDVIGWKLMELQTFPTERKKTTVIDKILRILIIGLLLMVVVLLIDATGTLAQIYEKEYEEWPESWIVKPIAEWYEDKKVIE